MCFPEKGNTATKVVKSSTCYTYTGIEAVIIIAYVKAIYGRDCLVQCRWFTVTAQLSQYIYVHLVVQGRL